jgi:hypothetical protein
LGRSGTALFKLAVVLDAPPGEGGAYGEEEDEVRDKGKHNRLLKREAFTAGINGRVNETVSDL